MLKRKLCVILIAGILAAAGSGYAAERETTDKDIDVAIEALKSYLWSKQDPDGHWPTSGSYNHRYMVPGGDYASNREIRVPENELSRAGGEGRQHFDFSTHLNTQRIGYRATQED